MQLANVPFGNYKQGRDNYCFGERYCYLGVLAKHAGLNVGTQLFTDGTGREVYALDVLRKYEEFQRLPHHELVKFPAHIVTMNDDEGKTFDEITARILERINAEA